MLRVVSQRLVAANRQVLIQSLLSADGRSFETGKLQ